MYEFDISYIITEFKMMKKNKKKKNLFPKYNPPKC